MIHLCFFFLLFATTTALNCDKDFTYYDSYGNGFNVTCRDITNDHIDVLQNMSINEEIITINVENSTITNATADLFRNFPNLKNLFIYNSIFIFPNTEKIFKYLKSLENLVIKNTDFRVTKYTFTGLDNLKNVIMSNNSLSKIEEGSFKHLPNLRKIEMTFNEINKMGDLPLCELKDLDALNMSRNSISSLRLPNFHCKSMSQQFKINLNNQKIAVNVANNKYENVADYGLTLTHLDLSYNKLMEIGDTVANLKLLRSLRLESNSLKSLHSVEIATLKHLEEIYLSNNNLELIEENLFDGKPNLELIDISQNKLLSVSINEVPQLKHLNLAYNQLNNLKILNDKTMKSLQILILNNNKFKLLQPNNFKEYSGLEILDLADNTVILTEQSFNGLVKLKILNLRNNSIDEISSNIFDNLIELKTLDLSYNKLKAVKYPSIFITLKNLETLNISHNFLNVLNHDIFEPLDKLKILDISGNQLKEIQHELIISHLKFLSVLDIKSNFFSCEFVKNIIIYIKSKNITYIPENTLEYKRENVGGIYCINEKTSALTVINVDHSNSGGRNVIFYISIAISVMFVFLLFAVFMFRMYIYMKRRKYRPDEFELIN